MRIGDTLKKAAGLFVELDETEEPTPTATPSATPRPIPSAAPAPTPSRRTVEQIVREAPGPNLDEIKVPSTPAAQPGPVITPEGSVDFNSIYQMAQLPSNAFGAEQVLELLNTLPAELPMETKRATLKVTLGAMAKTASGVSAETIVADASRKLAALAAFADGYGKQAEEYTTKAELEIINLEQEIARRRQNITEAKARQAKISEACVAESDRLDDVLEFFSLDVPPSKYAGTP